MPGKNAFGSKLRRGGTSSGDEFEGIANITSISGPSMEREDIDVTSHDSEDGWMEFVGGLKDGGEVEVDFNYDPGEDTHNALQDDFDDEDPRYYQVVFPDADETAWEFKAIMTGLEPEMPHDDKLECSMTLKVSGKPELKTLAGEES